MNVGAPRNTANRLIVLIREDLLTTLAPGHTFLLLLSELAGSELLLLGNLDLVTKGIKLVTSLLLFDTRTATLTLDPVVAGWGHLTVNDGPDFLSETTGELLSVGNDDDTTIEGLESLRQSTERVAVEIVGRFVKNDQVRPLPGGGGQADLDTLTTRETLHARVGDQLGIETEVAAVDFDFLSDQRTESTGLEGNLLIDIGDHLSVGGDKLGTLDPAVLGGRHGNPLLTLHADVLTEKERALVLVRVLVLATAGDGDDTTLGTIDLEDLVHGELVVIGDLFVGTVHGLTILTGLETPLDVLRWSLVQVVIDVGESVLFDVCDTDVLVDVDVTLGGDQFTGQNVDKSGFTSTVGSNDSDTRSKRDLEGDIGQLWLGGTWILELHLVDLDDSLGLGLDTFEETWFWELELKLGGSEFVVGLGGWDTGDEGLEVTSITLKLESLVVDDVLADIVKETGVVGNNDGSALGVAEVVLEPLDVDTIQMVGRLVEEEDIGVLEDGTAKSQLHLPTTREGGDRVLEPSLLEAELKHGLLDFIAGLIDTSFTQLLQGPANDSLLGISGIKIVLDEDGLDLGLGWETLDLFTVDSTHESRLAGTVGTAETITLTTLETKVGLVEKDLGTVGKVEGTVAEIFTFLIIGLTFLSLGDTRSRALAEGVDNGLGVGLTDEGSEGWGDMLEPDQLLVGLLIVEGTGNAGEVVEDWLVLAENFVVVAGGDDGLESLEQDSWFGGIGDLWDLAIWTNITNTLESIETTFGNGASFGIGNGVEVLLETGHELRQERSDNLRILDELAHVVDNDGGFTLDSSLTLSEATLEKRNHDGQGWSKDILDEGGGTEQVNGLWDVLGSSDTVDQLRNETIDIFVADQSTDVLHGLPGSLLDLWLGFPHGLRDDRNAVGSPQSELRRSNASEGVNALESSDLFWPLSGILDGVEDDWENGLDGIRVDVLNDSESSLVSKLLDGGHLVTNGDKDGSEKLDHVGLDGWSQSVTSNGLDGREGTLTNCGILLVVELLLEVIDEFRWNFVLFDRTVDEGSKVLSSVFGLLSLRNRELLEEVLEDLDRLDVLGGGR